VLTRTEAGWGREIEASMYMLGEKRAGGWSR
jgi:hypothetical protein